MDPDSLYVVLTEQHPLLSVEGMEGVKVILKERRTRKRKRARAGVKDSCNSSFKSGIRQLSCTDIARLLVAPCVPWIKGKAENTRVGVHVPKHHIQDQGL